MSFRGCSVVLGLAVVTALTAVGCASPAPVASGGAAPIPVRVAVVTLVDSTSADTTSMPEGVDLAGALSDVIAQRLREDAVFEVVERDLTRPDLVLSGTIQRFYGATKPNALQVVLAILTGLSFESTDGAVELDLALERPDGERVASYRANAEFSKWKSVDTSDQTTLRAGLDEALRGALVDLGNQIRADRAKLSGLRRTSALD